MVKKVDNTSFFKALFQLVRMIIISALINSNNRKKIMENLIQKSINEFKKGVSDGLLNGNSKEGPRGHYYKQGYDFGIALYTELEKYFG